MKQVARSLTEILENPSMIKILDRSQDVSEVTTELLDSWSYDLYKRSPGSAYTNDGVFQGTDLDLICFLSALSDRNAVINLPKYESRRARTHREGERVVSTDNRHGKIVAVTANKKVFSFSIRIIDANVITTSEVGAPRNFMLTDLSGNWYDGWKSVEFVPSAKENAFLNDKNLWSGNTIFFKNFVSPNRWISFFGSSYFLSKVLVERLEQEAKFLQSIYDELWNRGIRFPLSESGDSMKKEWPRSVREEGESIKVRTFEAEVDFGEFNNEFPKPTASNPSELLKLVADKRREILYTTIPKLRVPIRATELAFFLYGENGEKLPGWIQNAKFERDYIEPGKRTMWNRLILSQRNVGERGIALRYRVYEKSEIVAKDE